jgi:hypothetical protein
LEGRLRQINRAELNGTWEQRKKDMESTVAASDRYQAQVAELIDHHTKEIVAAANELTTLYPQSQRARP